MVKLYMVIKEGMDILSEIDTALLDSQLLMMHILNVDKSYLFLNRERVLLENEYKSFINLINKRKRGIPLQYITGIQEFMGLDFRVKEGVLIPRCDTEVLVETSIEVLKEKKEVSVADVGCGSGAISVSIASFIENANVYALDIMDVPLKVTGENAVLNGVEKRVHIKESNMLEYIINNNIKLDMVVSNPPYIRTDVIESLMKEVKDHEPMSALDGGKSGLYFYENITKQAKMVLKEKGCLAYEIGHDQGAEVKSIMEREGFVNVSVIKDLAGLDRVVIGYTNI